MPKKLLWIAWAFALTASVPALASTQSGRPLRVGVIGSSAPMSYLEPDGRLTGVNVELARALCTTMKASCEFVLLTLREVVDNVSRDEVDFAAVSLLITPERNQKVLFTKPYYRSLTAWVARPALKPGAAQVTVGVVRGGVQAAYAHAQGWRTVEVPVHAEMPDLVLAGKVNATMMPMMTALEFLKHPGVARLGWEYRLMSEPEMAGDVGFAVSPRRAEVRDRLNAAIDQVKSDGRFDRISSQFLPFKLQ